MLQTDYLATQLKKYFGHTAFRPLQKEVVDSVFSGKDCLVILPTGGGKSLCYQLPALCLPGLSVVVSPLIALMQDQVQNLQKKGISAEFLNSSLDQKEQDKIVQNLIKNYTKTKKIVIKPDKEAIKILYISPERLFQNRFWEIIKKLDISFFAVDEAHCISTWGHDFRPGYTKLKLIKESFPSISILALTATADKLTQKDILQQLNIPKAKLLTGSFDRHNIHYTIKAKQGVQDLVNLLKQFKKQSGIIYTLSRNEAEKIAKDLKDSGFKCNFYHARLPSSSKEKVLNSFLQGKIQIIVATIAFGMGIDKPDVRFVIHWNLPKNLENYYQETGRAGRDGLPAKAVLLFDSKDVSKQESFLNQTDIEIASVHSEEELERHKEIQKQKLQKLVSFTQLLYCRRRVLLSYFDELLPLDCNYCDICELNQKKDLFDATTPSKKVFCAIARTNQTLDLEEIVSILTGYQTKLITNRRHHLLPTFGVGKEYNFAQWQVIIEHLLALGFLKQDAHKENLKLTSLSVLVLQDKNRVFLQKLQIKKSDFWQNVQTWFTPEVKYNPHFRPSLICKDTVDKLRKLRLGLAEQERVVTQAIFSDEALADIALKKPKNLFDLTQISGFDKFRIKKFGLKILKTLKEN